MSRNVNTSRRHWWEKTFIGDNFLGWELKNLTFNHGAYFSRGATPRPRSGAGTRGVTPHPRSGAATRGVTLRLRSRGAARRRYPKPLSPRPGATGRKSCPTPRCLRPRLATGRSNPTSKELWLRGPRRA